MTIFHLKFDTQVTIYMLKRYLELYYTYMFIWYHFLNGTANNNLIRTFKISHDYRVCMIYNRAMWAT